MFLHPTPLFNERNLSLPTIAVTEEKSTNLNMIQITTAQQQFKQRREGKEINK